MRKLFLVKSSTIITTSKMSYSTILHKKRNNGKNTTARSAWDTNRNKKYEQHALNLKKDKVAFLNCKACN